MAVDDPGLPLDLVNFFQTLGTNFGKFTPSTSLLLKGDTSERLTYMWLQKTVAWLTIKLLLEYANIFLFVQVIRHIIISFVSA